MDKLAADRPPKPRGRGTGTHVATPCKFFQSASGCRKGSACKHEHIQAPPTTRAPPPPRPAAAHSALPPLHLMVKPGKSLDGEVHKMRGFVVALLLEPSAERALSTVTEEGCAGLTIVREVVASPERFHVAYAGRDSISFQPVLGLLQLLCRVQYSTNTGAVNALLAALVHHCAFVPRCLELLEVLLRQRDFGDPKHTKLAEERARYGADAWMGPASWDDVLMPVWILTRLVCERYRDRLADIVFVRAVHARCQQALALGDLLAPATLTQTTALSRLTERTLHEHARAQLPPKEVPSGAAAPRPQDGPGAQSSLGARHDNDHEDFRRISVMPTADELLSTREPYVPTNCATNTATVEGYLDMQFRLLRQDLLQALQHGLRQFRQAGGVGALGPGDSFVAKSYDRHDNTSKIWVNRHVSFVALAAERTQPLAFEIEFDQSSRLAKLARKERERLWQCSKKLKYGSLVVLWSDSPAAGQPPLICALKVVHRDARAMSADRPRLLLSCDESAVPLVVNVLRSRAEVVLLELSVGYLEGLATAAALPFAEYLTGGAPVMHVVRAPAYTTHQLFDLTHLCKPGSPPLMVDLSKPERFPVADLVRRSTLDTSQAVALKAMLCQEVSVVQGPPGCGKTFIGIKFVASLLKHNGGLLSGPILCVCYTNHALDQFLEGLLDEGIVSMARIGSRVQSERLERFQLRELEHSSTYKNTGLGLKKLYERLETAAGVVRELERQILKPEQQRLADVAAILGWECPLLLESFSARQRAEDADDAFTTVGRTEKDVFAAWVKCDDLKEGKPTKGRKKGRAKQQQQQNNAFAALLPAKDKEELDDDDETNEDAATAPTVVATGPRPLVTLKKESDPFTFSREERAAFATWLLTELRDAKKAEVTTACQEYERARVHVQQVQDLRKAHVLRSVALIGATTTGAAGLIDTLQAVKPCVLVCEEAAEILEAHVLSSLSSNVQQLVLIGDHQQLRPKVETYHFQADSKRGYDLDVSLFERLLLRQKTVAGVQLTTQHRMRPDIADLIRSQIYPDLLDHPSVALYPDVRGVFSNCFFWDHSCQESKDANANSYVNAGEAQRVVMLVRHLCLQGYGRNAVTVLSPYVGQLLLLRRLLSREFSVSLGEQDEELVQEVEADADEQPAVDTAAAPHYVAPKALSAHVRVATIDNFQGEESDVIVISLVRNNDDGRIGFLKVVNRANVMLSRAKHGMFLLGNAQILEHSGVPFWASVIDTLRRRSAVSTALPVHCQKHPNAIQRIVDPSDFAALSPDGGCLLQCGARLACGHSCKRFCHSDDPKHLSVQCMEPCARLQEGCRHLCQKSCWESCDPCLVAVTHTFDDCGHTQDMVCHQRSAAKCASLVHYIAARCGHACQVRCHDARHGTPECALVCGAGLPCGHTCKSKCADCAGKPSHGKCITRCIRPLACGHACGQLCHEGMPCGDCKNACTTACVHSRCEQKCGAPCSPCAQMCAWSCPHEHQCALPCGAPCTRLPCDRRCEELLRCGHRCPSVCGEVCPSDAYCVAPGCKNATHGADCVSFTDMELTLLDNPCDADPVVVLGCGHVFAMSELDSWLGLGEAYVRGDGGCGWTGCRPLNFALNERKGCPAGGCNAAIRRVYRYGRLLAKAFVDATNKKFLPWVERQQDALEHDIGSSADATARALKRLATLRRETASGGPTGKMIAASLHVLRNDVAAVAALGVPAHNPWPKLRTDLLIARCHFALDKDGSRKKALATCGDVIREAAACGLGRAQAAARVQRAGFISHTATPRHHSMADQQWIAQHRLESIRGGPLGMEAKRMLDSMEMKEMRTALEAIGGQGGWYSGTHWFTCPNGHPYVIGDCGGAMMTSSCPDCGAVVGGGGHRLRDDNANVPSMDALLDHVVPVLSAPTLPRLDNNEDEEVEILRPAQLIAQQDAEYAASLAADRAKAPALLDEPAAGSGVLTVRVRVHDLPMQQRRFRAGAPLAELGQWIRVVCPALPARWRLRADFPRRHFYVDDEPDVTLEVAGVDDQITMFVEEEE